jgi:ATP-dependent Clp protease ATP-binding subunit ClpC
LRKKAILHGSEALNLTVEYEDIAGVVTDWTGVPVNRLIEAESNKLLSLEDNLKSKIIGQDEAIHLIAQAIRRGRIGLKSPDAPTGSFIFVGPTGVGKTELCIVLAEILFGTKNALLRFDMSEYMEKHSISKLIGAPPGYVGYGEGGILTEKVRRNPYCIILFDEIEKAHPEIFNLLLQILEDGTLTDASGRKVSFKNSLIVMTSNLGSINNTEKNTLGFFDSNDEKAQSRQREKRIKKALENTFKPEFLNRVDEIVIFNSLTKENIEEICSLMLSTLSERLQNLGLSVNFDESLISKIANEAFDNGSGARKLRREIRRLIENPLSSKMLSGDIKGGDLIFVKEENEKIDFVK